LKLTVKPRSGLAVLAVLIGGGTGVVRSGAVSLAHASVPVLVTMKSRPSTMPCCSSMIGWLVANHV
jgi:hypothetical protein